MNCLYHYCSNEKFFNMLSGKTIRMGDISKSNDAAELELLFPKLHRVIFKKYLDNPFSFKLDSCGGIDAMRLLIETSEELWENRFIEGDFANFVLCFSEKRGLLKPMERLC